MVVAKNAIKVFEDAFLNQGWPLRSVLIGLVPFLAFFSLVPPYILMTVGYSSALLFFAILLASVALGFNYEMLGFLDSSFLKKCGVYSYGLYVYHFPIYQLLRYKYMSPPFWGIENGWQLWIIIDVFGVFLTAALAVTSYEFVESRVLALMLRGYRVLPDTKTLTLEPGK